MFADTFDQTLVFFQQTPFAFNIFVIILSLMIGSFLNVVVYRLPQMMQNSWYNDCREFLADELKDIPAKKIAPITLSTPNSSCPKCGHQIRFYENIPVISWLFLKGKCSQCKNSISIRYPLVETATALLSFVVALQWGVSIETCLLLVLTWGLICLTLIDFDHMLLPDQIVMPLLWLGLLINIQDTFVPLQDAVIGAAAGYMSLFSVFWLFKLLTGKEGMGFGDFKLFALFGAWAGWQLLPMLILMASVVGALVGITLVLLKKNQREQAIPFGPYLALAGWVTLLWGEGIWAWYLLQIS